MEEAGQIAYEEANPVPNKRQGADHLCPHRF